MALPKEKFEEIKSKIQKFIDHEMVDHENDLSFNHKFADHLSFLEEKRNMVREMGLFAPQIPKEHGGLGLSLHQLGQIQGVKLCDVKICDFAGNSELTHFDPLVHLCTH